MTVTSKNATNSRQLNQRESSSGQETQQQNPARIGRFDVGAGVSTDTCPISEQTNIQQFVSKYETGDGDVQMPLNRTMRRYAKCIGIKLTKVAK